MTNEDAADVSKYVQCDLCSYLFSYTRKDHNFFSRFKPVLKSGPDFVSAVHAFAFLNYKWAKLSGTAITQAHMHMHIANLRNGWALKSDSTNPENGFRAKSL